jgi:hypothetical protein
VWVLVKYDVLQSCGSDIIDCREVFMCLLGFLFWFCIFCFCDRYSSPNIIRVIKSRRMRWAGHVARMGGKREVHTGFWWGDLRERDDLGDPGGDGRIILK